MINQIKRYYKNAILAIAMLTSVGLPLALPAATFALPAAQIFAQNETTIDNTKNPDVSCPTDKSFSGTQAGNGAGCILKHIVAPIVGALVALSGLAVVISIIIAGIQYSASGGDPSKVAASRKRIFNAVVALLAFMFLYAFINWVIPGGILHGGNVQNG